MPKPLIDAARDLSSRFAGRAAHWDRTRSYPWENVAALQEAGLMGATVPQAYGGRGAGLQDILPVIEEIAKACTLTARIFVEGNMGAISAVMAYGSAVQKARCAALVLAGEKPAICISEPDAGSAASQMTTTARRDGTGYVLNGTKHWITGGGVSKLHLIFARVLSDTGLEQGIGAFIVVCDPSKGEMPEGFKVVGRETTMGLRGMPEATLSFENLRVDAEMALLPAGGFADLMSAYNTQRVGAGAIAMGVAAGATQHAIRYLKERHQFGRPIAEFQGLQWMLADMETGVSAARLLLQDAALSADTFPDPTKAAKAKLFASETAIKVVNDALQMFGARGYSDREPLERMYRDVRMFTIGGGTAQVLRTQIASRALGQKLPQTRDGHMLQAEPLAAE